MDDILLRVHSEDLHDHVAQEVGECLESGLYTDLMIRCKDGQTLHAHKLVLSAASPFLRMLLENNDWEEVQTLELPDISSDDLALLLEVVYNGVVEATIEDLRSLILLAHNLYITIPLSEELMDTLELTLPKIPPFIPRGLPKLKVRPNFTPANYTMKPSFPAQKVPMLKLKLPIPSSAGEKKKTTGLVATMSSSSPEKSKKYDHVCPICNSKYANVNNFKQHMKSHDNEQLREQRNKVLAEIVASSYNPSSSLYTCNYCESTYNHAGNFKQHLLKHDRESGIISAMLVDQEEAPVSSNSHLSKVLKSAITNKTIRMDDSENGGKTALYNCDQCGRAFNHAGNYKQHLSSHLRTSKSNGTIEDTKRQLNALLELQASPKKRSKVSSSTEVSSFAVVTCPDCNLEFPNVDELEDHISYAHKSEVTIDDDSDQPDESNSSERSVNPPLRTVFKTRRPAPEPEPEFVDDVNWSQWVPISGRKPGRPPITQPRDFECEFCGKVFHKRRKLTAHVKIHSAPEDHYRFPCDICGKKFTRQQHVNRHKILHSGERPFACATCNKTFAREDKYKHHVRTNCEQNQNSDELGLGHEMDEGDVANDDPLDNADSYDFDPENGDVNGKNAEENDMIIS